MDRTVEAKRAAVQVLLKNQTRTAGTGYPESYTRDWMISSLGMLVTGNRELLDLQRHVLQALAEVQSPLGQIPGLANDARDLGSSDTTPLFLIGLAFFRKVTREATFLDAAAQRALTWMKYRSLDETGFVPQEPTSDWRDELWVEGYGLYVNTLIYTYLRLWGREDQASVLRDRMAQVGLEIPDKPYYALWAYKIHRSERFDLMGNSLAILSGIADPPRANAIIDWVENACQELREQRLLAPTLSVPPSLIPYVQPSDSDWRERYGQLCPPGEYLNGGVWPFVCAFYIAALVATGRYGLAEEKLAALTELVRPTRSIEAEYGFNEWFRAQDGKPGGEDWQTWSAAMYLYAVACVEQRRTPFFEDVRDSRN